MISFLAHETCKWFLRETSAILYLYLEERALVRRALGPNYLDMHRMLVGKIMRSKVRNILQILL